MNRIVARAVSASRLSGSCSTSAFALLKAASRSASLSRASASFCGSISSGGVVGSLVGAMVAVGGVTIENVREYLQAGTKAVGGGISLFGEHGIQYI